MKTLLTLCIICLTTTSFLWAQERSTFSKELYVSRGDTLPYRMLLPKDFQPEKEYPLLLFLHGSGERGNDNEAQLVHGSRLFLSETTRSEFPAIVIFPQCEAGASWNNSVYARQDGQNTFTFPEAPEPNRQLALVEELLDFVQENYKIDNSRIYLGGLSMGGMGTFELLLRNPHYFAAAFPICGGANPKIAKKIKYTPLWIFHGAKDVVVPSKYSRDMYEALKKENAQVQLTIYPETGHDSWTNAFSEPQLLSWVFAQHRK